MATTREELDHFHRFAAQQLRAGGPEVTIETLLVQWRSERQKEATRAAIQQGLADIENGNYRSLDDFMREFRTKNHIPDDA